MECVYYRGYLLKGGSFTVDLYYTGCLFRRFILQWLSIIGGVVWGVSAIGVFIKLFVFGYLKLKGLL